MSRRSLQVISAVLTTFIGFTGLEIIGAPLFVSWQAQIAERQA